LLLIICRLGTDKQIADAITSLERQSLRDKMAHWGDELNEEEIERLSRKVLIKWSGIFLGHYLFNKLNQEVMWRTESKLALVAIALIVLGGIYGMSNKSNNRKADAIAVLMEKLIVTIMYCSILPMMSRWIKEH
jgi:hypothetical protein